MSIVLVTGASGGIGSAICRGLARRGATLALHYQSDREGAEEARRSLEGSGHALVQADLAEPGSIERLWREATRLGPVDALINNAGIFPDHPPLASSYDEWTPGLGAHAGGQPGRCRTPVLLRGARDERTRAGDESSASLHAPPFAASRRRRPTPPARRD